MGDQALAGSARTSTLPDQPFAAAKPGTRLSRRRLLVAGAALLLAAGAAWYGHQWWTVGRFTESTDDAYVGGDITVLAPKISGFIAVLAVTDNQVVHAGDLLVRLDDRDYRAAFDHAEAGVAAQQARLASNTANRRLQAATIAQAQAALDATAAQTVVTRFDADRYRSLARDQFGSIQRFQQADADAKKAVAADAQAHAAVDAAERQRDVIDAARLELVAALAAAVAERETARLNLGYTELRAPVDGVVGNRSAQVGAYVTPGRSCCRWCRPSGLWVDANFKESQLARIRPGMAASVVADVLPGQVFRGHVASMAPATGAVFSVLPAENATGNFTKIVQRVPVRVLLDGDRRTLGTLAARPVGHRSIDERARETRRGGADDGPTGVRLRGDVRGHVHRPAGHPDRLGLAARHRRRPVRRHGRDGWVQTSYLIAEIIVIPLSGWLSRVMSTRWLFCASATGFTLASLLCGAAWNIQSMIVFRALQGFLGGSMIPMVFTTAFAFFQGPKVVVAAATIGAMSSLAPTLGPPCGGWITDNYSWHWLFFVNLLPGAFVAVVVPILVRVDKPDLSLLRGADYPGMVLMALFLGCLEYTLEEGTRWGWLDDDTIRHHRLDLRRLRRAVRLAQPGLRAPGGGPAGASAAATSRSAASSPSSPASASSPRSI